MTVFQAEDATERADGTQLALAGMRRGDVFGLNADSAYALATDAFSLRGVQRIDVLKKNATFATPVLVGRPQMIEGIVADVTDDMRKLIDAFWPGRLTLLVRPSQTLAWGGNRGAIAVRMPTDEWTREIAGEIGALVAVAASRGAHKVPTTATQAAEIWGSEVPHWLASGSADPELLSTVIDFRGSRPNITRLGTLTASNIRGVLPTVTMIAH